MYMGFLYMGRRQVSVQLILAINRPDYILFFLSQPMWRRSMAPYSFGRHQSQPYRPHFGCTLLEQICECSFSALVPRLMRCVYHLSILVRLTDTALPH